MTEGRAWKALITRVQITTALLNYNYKVLKMLAFVLVFGKNINILIFNIVHTFSFPFYASFRLYNIVTKKIVWEKICWYCSIKTSCLLNIHTIYYVIKDVKKKVLYLHNIDVIYLYDLFWERLHGECNVFII